MRIDLFLKKTRIFKTRSAAKAACDAGFVTVNGRTAKAAAELRAGDLVHLRMPRRDAELRVLEIPGGNVAKNAASHYLQILRDDRLAGWDAVEPGFDIAED